MAGKTPFEGQVLELLARLKITKERIQEECNRKLSDIDQQIEAVSTTLRLLREPVTEQVITVEAAPIQSSTLIGKSAREALIEIAKQRGGRVRIVEAIPLLAGAGVIRRTKNSWNALYTTLIRSKEFEKAGGGEFSLVQPPSDQTALRLQ